MASKFENSMGNVIIQLLQDENFDYYHFRKIVEDAHVWFNDSQYNQLLQHWSLCGKDKLEVLLSNHPALLRGAISHIAKSGDSWENASYVFGHIADCLPDDEITDLCCVLSKHFDSNDAVTHPVDTLSPPKGEKRIADVEDDYEPNKKQRSTVE
jgi:hypothetical protein